MKKILIAISITLISNASYAECKGKKVVRVKDVQGTMRSVDGNDACVGSRETAREFVASRITSADTKAKIAELACPRAEMSRAFPVMVYYRAWGRDNQTLGDRELSIINVNCNIFNARQSEGLTLKCPTSVLTAAIDSAEFTAQRDGAGTLSRRFKSAKEFENRLYCFYGPEGTYRVSAPLPGKECNVRGDTVYCASR
jgi:hypothetical protein